MEEKNSEDGFPGLLVGKGKVRELAGGPESVIASLRNVLENHAMAMVDGALVDVQTANAICTVYDNLQPKNQTKLVRMPLVRMAETCWKVLERAKRTRTVEIPA